MTGAEGAVSMLYAYTAAVDDHDYERLVSLFTPEARVNLGDTVRRGREDIGQAYRKSFASSRQTKHIVTNVVTDNDQTSSRARAYLFVTGLKGKVLSVAWGTYACTAVRHDSGWLIDELSIALDVPFLELPVQKSDKPERRPPLQATDLIDVVSRYLGALERFDLEEASSCFTENVFYSHPPYSSEDNGGRRHEVNGREDLIALFEKRGPKSVEHEIQHGAIAGRSGFVRGVFSSEERRGSFVSAVTLAEDGRIESYAAYSSIPGVAE